MKLYLKKIQKNVEINFYVNFSDQKPNSTDFYDKKFKGLEFIITPDMVKKTPNLRKIMVLVEGRVNTVAEAYLSFSCKRFS